MCFVYVVSQAIVLLWFRDGSNHQEKFIESISLSDLPPGILRSHAALLLLLFDILKQLQRCTELYTIIKIVALNVHRILL